MPHQKYPSQIRNFAKAMRNEPTSAEYKLWGRLRNSQTGVKFRRQQHIDGKYIVDFLCPELKLIIEIDGATHSSDKEIFQDKIREDYLASQGFEIMRFYNPDIYKNLGNIMQLISQRIWELQEARKLYPPQC